MTAILAALLALIAALLAPPAPAPADPLHWIDGTAVCLEEDGSTLGQEFPCRWEAADQGNRIGTSYVLTGPAS